MVVRRLPTLLAAACLVLVAAAPAQAHRDTSSEIDDIDIAASVRAAQASAGAQAADDGLPLTWCGTERATDDTANAAFPASLPQFKVVYARPSDQPNRFDDFKDALQANVALIGRFLSAQSGGLKAPRFDMGTSCGPQYVDVQSIVLPQSRLAYVDDYWEVRAAVASRLNQTPGGARNVFILADTLSPYAPDELSGVAVRYDDDSPGAGNASNEGGLSAIVWVPLGQAAPAQDPSGFWPEGMLHEMAHTIGAVQWSAPHTTHTPGGPAFYGHCWDEWDVMCYQDGPAPAHALSYDCPNSPDVIGQEFDCNRDDYFNPAPAVGTYLSTHWNLFNSVFLAPCATIAPACGGGGSTPIPTPPVATADPLISGIARKGELLTVSNGTWLNSPTAYAYQWYRSDGLSFAAIPGAVQTTYAAAAADVGRQLRVVVTAQNAFGSAAVASPATATVTDVATPPPPPPTTAAAPAGSAATTQQVAPVSSAPSSGRATLKIAVGRGRGKKLGSVGFAVAAGRLRATTSPLRLAKGRYTLTVCTTAGARAATPRCKSRRVRVSGRGRYRVPVLSITVPRGVNGRASVFVTAVGRFFAARTTARPAQGVLLGS
jgi:hypothetical protein